jgi:ATP synthase protein I
MTDPEGRAKPQSNPSDIDELGRKLDQINAKRKTVAEPAQASASNMAEGLKYASEFSAAVLVGAALGWGVDKLTGITPFGLLGGLFLGLCAGVLNVVRAAKEGMDGSGEDLPPNELYEDDDA